VRRHRDVEHLDALVFEQLAVVVVEPRDRMPRRDGLRLLRVLRGDGDRVKARRAVRHQVAVRHDETGPDTTDADGAVFRQPRKVFQIEIDHSAPAGSFSALIVWSVSGSMNESFCAGLAPTALMAESSTFFSGV